MNLLDRFSNFSGGMRATISYEIERAKDRKSKYIVSYEEPDSDKTFTLEKYIDLNHLHTQVSEDRAMAIIDQLIAAQEAGVFTKALETAPNSRFILKSTDPEDTTIFTLTNVCDGAACEFPMEIRFDRGAVTLVKIEM